jgi:hypothetical protein
MGDFQRWPPLPLNEWQDTYRTLHMWTQIVGKIRMTLTPPMNHWWHATPYVNSRGLTTGPVPFISKCSPVHFFWGSCDLACTRFSGRLTPPRRGVISGPAYSHEVCSAGFWPSGGAVDGPAYYSYSVPRPASIDEAQVRPGEARWNAQLSEFILMYDDVRRAARPKKPYLNFWRARTTLEHVWLNGTVPHWSYEHARSL